MKFSLIIPVVLIAAMTINAQTDDPFLWLENVDDEKAMEWVEKQNKQSVSELTASPHFEPIFQKNMEILNSKERIPYPSLIGGKVYNFWQDDVHERGIWRRCDQKSYLDGNPNWEILLDIDKMAEEDDIQWVYKGSQGLFPDYNRFLVSLSKGGGDAVVTREFDVEKKEFVKDGFYLPEAKGGMDWIDINTVMVATTYEAPATTSGYSRQVKIWKRGTDLKDATLLYEGQETDVGTWGGTFHTKERVYQLVTQATTFYTSKKLVVENGELITLDVPDDASFSGFFKENVIMELKSDWTVEDKTYRQGAVISIPYNDLIKGGKNFTVIIQPDEKSSVSSVRNTKNRVLVNMLTNVKSELFAYTLEDGKWIKEQVDAPDFGTISIGSTDRNSDQYFFYFSNFLNPSTQYLADAVTGEVKKVQSLPAFFEADKYKVKQFFATSKDGTKIPYFVVSSKSIKLDGKNPTLLYAYGGFEVSVRPNYSATTGTGWLENGGVYVLANIRGGGEFGPKWHQAGLKENRQRVYDDFAAVAEDLIDKKITSSDHLGIMGGSNGGLLVGVAFTQRPDLYNAVVCAVPLLDMKRYSKLLAGASWMGEYGDPDKPEEWAYIKEYSPYHNLSKAGEYPKVFFYTSTRDDRVHPGHARKMVAKMKDMGHEVFYFENTEGGHAAATTNEQRAKMNAMVYSYLLMQLE